jgi:hypothetical protein
MYLWYYNGNDKLCGVSDNNNKIYTQPCLEFTVKEDSKQDYYIFT